MTSSVTFCIGTDLLWNSEDPEDYARLVEKVEPDMQFESEQELEDHIFRWYPYITEEGEVDEKSREADKLSRNLYGVELLKENPPEVYLRGLNLFKAVNGGYQISEQGARFRELYVEAADDPTTWKSYLLELLGRYFIRVRTLLYYIGVEGYRLKWRWQGGTFNGDGIITRGEISYPFYIVGGNRNSARTFEGLTNEVAWNEFGLESAVPRRMYGLEYALLSADYDLPSSDGERILELRSQFRNIVLESGDTPSEAALDHVIQEMREFQAEVDLDPTVSKRFEFSMNLMWDANRRSIIGPFNLEETGPLLEGSIDEIETSGRNYPEPKGKQVMVVLRRGLKPLVNLGILAELHEDNWGIDNDQVERLFSDELREDLFTANFSIERDDEFLNVLEEVCYDKRMNKEGDVSWGEVLQEAMNRLGMDKESTFNRKMEEHITAGAIEIRGIRKKNAWMPDGPPGYENYGTVRISINT